MTTGRNRKTTPARATRDVSRVAGAGDCYPAAEVVYHASGGKRSGLTPVQIKHEGQSHWFVRDEHGEVYDPTAWQFDTLPRYDEGVGRGFLTRRASRRGRAMAREAGLRLNGWRNPQDERLRELERRAQESPNDRLLRRSLLVERMRRGFVSHARVQLAALLWDPIAEAVVERPRPRARYVDGQICPRCRYGPLRRGDRATCQIDLPDGRVWCRREDAEVEPRYAEGWEAFREIAPRLLAPKTDEHEAVGRIAHATLRWLRRQAWDPVWHTYLQRDGAAYFGRMVDNLEAFVRFALPMQGAAGWDQAEFELLAERLEDLDVALGHLAEGPGGVMRASVRALMSYVRWVRDQHPINPGFHGVLEQVLAYAEDAIERTRQPSESTMNLLVFIRDRVGPWAVGEAP